MALAFSRFDTLSLLVMGHIKAEIYHTQRNSNANLNRGISAETNRINEETLEKVWDNMKFRPSYITQ